MEATVVTQLAILAVMQAVITGVTWTVITNIAHVGNNNCHTNVKNKEPITYNIK